MVKTTKKAIDDFKAFVKKYPKLAKVKRENELSWQDLFEEWVLYGEDEDFWKEYGVQIKSGNQEKKLFNFGKGSSGDWSKMLSFLNQLDPDDLQEKLKQVDGALTTLSGLIGQFTSSNSSSGTTNPSQNQNRGNGPGPYPPFGQGPNYPYYNRD